MAGILLWALVLLLALGDVPRKTGAESCRVWVYATELRLVTIQCPANAKFCCGTCQLSYCCPMGQARLDLESCLANSQLKANSMLGQMEKAPRHHLGQILAISNASWFYIAVVLTCLFGACVCLSRDKYRQWMLGYNENLVESEGVAFPGGRQFSDPTPYVSAGDPSSAGHQSTSVLSPASADMHVLPFCGVNVGNQKDETAAAPAGTAKPGPSSTSDVESLV